MSHPALSSPPTSTPCPAPPSPSANQGKTARTVLLVDDDTGVLAVVGETIATMGHTVITAQDGCRALHLLIDNRSINCLFTDVVMSSTMNGMQLITAARAVRPGLPTLLASSYPREDVYAMGDIPSDVCFITKPYLLSDLHEALYWHSGAGARAHEPPSRTSSRSVMADHRRCPSRLWLGAASRTVLLGQSWIHDDTE